jgi:hypothetical protein
MAGSLACLHLSLYLGNPPDGLWAACPQDGNFISLGYWETGPMTRQADMGAGSTSVPYLKANFHSMTVWYLAGTFRNYKA